MNQTSSPKFHSIPVALLVLGLAACSGRQQPPHTAESQENLPPNSADIHQEEMKNSEEVSDDRQEEALEEATEDVDNASVIRTDERDLKTDDVDSDPND
jgi:hypothetical protein